MTITTLEPATIEALDFRPGCYGRTIATDDGSWHHYECSSNAEIARIKKCGCVVLQCMSCRNKIKERIEYEVARFGWRSFFCTICTTRSPEVRSYWDMTLREVPL